MPDIFSPVAQGHNCHRRILDCRQHRLKSRIHLAEQSARYIRRRRQYQPFRDNDFLAARLANPHLEPDSSCLATNANSNHLRGRPQPRTNFRCQSPHQRLIAILKAQQRRFFSRSFARFRRSHHPANHAACGLFRLVKLREGAAQTEALRIAGVNPRNERRHQAVQQLLAELSANKRGDGLVL